MIPIPRDAAGRRVSFIAGCEDCGLLFANPLRTADELERFYAPDGPWAATHEARVKKLSARHRKQVEKNRPPKTRKRYGARDVLMDALEPYVSVHQPRPGAKALDFGCGDGKFLDRLQRWGWQTCGIEPSTDLPFERHQQLEVPPQDGSFDFVILHHVLEHVSDPLTILKQLAASLRQGGVMFVSVPNVDAVGEHRDLQYCLNGKNHIVCFSEACLKSLFARAGLAMTARLPRQLDDVLTEGKPLRMRVIATRTPTAPPLPGDPLRPALRALREYGRATGISPLVSMLPVRVQAALLHRARERSPRRITHGEQ